MRRHAPWRLLAPLFLALAALWAVAPASPASAARPSRPGPAYWLVGADGGVFPFGRGGFAGALAARPTNGRVVAAAATPSGNGYWLAGSDGGVFAFGDAPWKGSVPSRSARAPMVALAATPSGHGYWLAGADGGVFAFGDAPFRGAVASLRLNAPVVAMAATSSGHGYWLAGADGGVYAFGDARHVGSGAAIHLNAPVVAMAATPSGRGYWLAAADGAVLAFGDARYLGSLTNLAHNAAVVGIARSRSGHGYWLATSDGGVFAFGDAGYYGSVGGAKLNGPIAAIAAGQGVAIPALPSSPTTSIGYDISWPQCGGAFPAPPYGFGVVGVTYGHLFSANPCLRDQWRWAESHASFAGVYVNTDAFSADELQAFLQRGASQCQGNVGCALYQWGRQGAIEALHTAGDLPAPRWWLDVETGNEWLPDPAANTVIVRAVIDTLRAAGKQVGLYSTSRQWTDIVGGFSPGLPTWVAGAPNDGLLAWCQGHSFGGGPTWMVQAIEGDYDIDGLCPAGASQSATVFADPAPLPVPEFVDTAAAARATPHTPVVSRALTALDTPGALAVEAAGQVAAGQVTGTTTLTIVHTHPPRRWRAWLLATIAALTVALMIAGASRLRISTRREAAGRRD